MAKPHLQPNSLRPASPDSGAAALNWADVLEEHGDSLRGLVLSKLGECESSVADDILQEVAIAAHASDAGSVDPERAGAWLRSVATHKVQDHWRRVRRQRRLRDRLEDEAVPDSGPAASVYDWVVGVDRRQAVAEALQELDDEDRAILRRKYLHGHSCGEIAEAFGLTAKATEYRLDRARKALRERLSQSHPSQP